MTIKLDNAIKLAKEAAAHTRKANDELQASFATLKTAIEKRYEGKPSTTATNATAPAPAPAGGQFVVNDRPFNDVLANYERV